MYRIDLISNLDQSTFRFNQHTVHSNEKHMVHNRNQILKAIAEHRDIIRSFGVSQLALFGSGARDERTKTSDLDFVVEFDKKSFDGYMDLKFYLEDLFNCSVDLVPINTIKPRLRETILGESVYAEGL